MPRFLIKTSLSTVDLKRALDDIGIEMDEYAPPRVVGADLLIDAGLSSAEENSSKITLRKRVAQINGVAQVLPVPDAEPGSLT